MAGTLAMAARMRAQVRPTTSFRPVEPGVTGKERTFQQNRNFGPGPISPYPNAKRPALVNNRRRGNGVYYGGSPSRARSV